MSLSDMSDQIKTLAPLIWSEIHKANNILLHCHPSPDGDSVGGVLGMKHVLSGLGKNVTIIMGDSDAPDTLAHLPGFSEIEQKNWFQIDLSKYDLFISQDSSALSQISKAGEVKFPPSMRVVVIDHHSTNTKYGHVNFVDSSSPAVCQMVYELCQEWSVNISPEAAACLYVGIYTDTGGFKYSATTSDSLKAAAHLAEINPDFHKAIFELENNYEPEQIRFIGLCLSSIEVYFSGKVAISAVSKNQLAAVGIEKKHTEKIEISNFLKSVKGWEVGIRFTETEPNLVTLSMRTRDPEKYDVGKIAVATGFGGGHKVAAGATIPKSFSEAKKFLLETIQKVYPDLGRP